jgi:hypothetical protein
LDDDRAGTVGVQRSQLLLVSSADVDKAAAAQYHQVVQAETPKGNVSRDPKQVERVRAVARASSRRRRSSGRTRSTGNGRSTC